jgi:hypothetical protein
MTFVLVVFLGAGLILLTSAMEDVSIADTVRGFIVGEVAKKATSQTTASTSARGSHTTTQTGK